MTDSAIAVRLKIPDNEARTTLAALQRLGVAVRALERAVVCRLQDAGKADDLRERFERDESLFNPNKHEITVLRDPRPRAGELWIETIDAPPAGLRIDGVESGTRFTAWRLFEAAGEPAGAQTLAAAADALLCNLAIERAIFP